MDLIAINDDKVVSPGLDGTKTSLAQGMTKLDSEAKGFQ
jgi:hypothetical protein